MFISHYNGHGIKLVTPLSTVDNTRDYARVSHSRQWSNYNVLNLPGVYRKLPAYRLSGVYTLQQSVCTTALAQPVAKCKRHFTVMCCCVSEQITFDSAVSPQHPRIYSDALIRCVVSGQPKPEISWRYKGRRLTFGLYRTYSAGHTRSQAHYTQYEIVHPELI